MASGSGKTADIIIIGAGMAGVSAAALLSEHARVIVLEREAQPATQSTARSAAMYLRNYGNATLRAITAAARPFFDNGAPENVKGQTLSPRGVVMFASRGQEALLDAELAGDPELSRMSREEIMALAPMLRRENVIGGTGEGRLSACDIDVDMLFQGYRSWLLDRKGAIAVGSEVISAGRNGANWQIGTTKGNYSAPVIVNAAGAWADDIARLAGVVQMELQPKRRSVAVLPLPEVAGAADWPLVSPLDESWYCKPQSGKLLVSPADAEPVPPHDAYPDDMVLAEGLHRFEMATDVRVTRVERSWAGLRTFAPDATPVVGFAHDAEGFFWLAGQGGYGIQTAPTLARIAASQIAGAKDRNSADGIVPEKVISALSPRRFQTQRMTQPR